MAEVPNLLSKKQVVTEVDNLQQEISSACLHGQLGELYWTGAVLAYKPPIPPYCVPG